MVASALTKSDGFCERVCVYVKLNVGTDLVSARHRIKPSAIQVEGNGGIGHVEADSRLIVKVKRYVRNDACAILFRSTAHGGSRDIASEHRIYKSVNPCDLLGRIVINEVVIMPIFDKYDNAITRICNKYGRVTLVKEVFAAARAANPDGTFLINDFNTSPQYEKLIEELLEAGVEISAIGIQSHQHQGYWGEAKLRDVLKRFSRFGLPIHFTENTLISGEIMPAYIEDLNDWQVDEWPTTEEGELRQEKEWEEMYRILFADPNIKAITGWDFADGAWLNAPSGLITKNNRCKPVYNKLLSLVKGEWWTKDETIHTNSDGIVSIKGTKGTYGIDGAEGIIKISSEPSEATVTI